MQNHHAAIMYAVKPSREIMQALEGLDCTYADWVSTNEFEAILQFLTRTSVRDVNSTADVVLHVFNREQAEYIEAFLSRQPHITCTVERVDLDLNPTTQRRQRTGPKPKIMTADEKVKQADERREKNRLRMAAWRAKA